MNLGTFVIPAGTRDIGPTITDETGGLRVMPAAFYDGTSQAERSLACLRLGLYLLPTFELVEYLRALIGGHSAIEIGAGNGALARELGIRATDNHMQQWGHIAKVYEKTRQAPVHYGLDVECLDAVVAIRRYKPSVVLGAWITHRYNPKRPHLGGNMYAPRENDILSLCERFIFIGNTSTHAQHPLLTLPHSRVCPPWIYSRAPQGENFVGVWSRGRE